VKSRERNKAKRKPWLLLLWVAVAGAVFGLLGLGQIVEDVLRTGRNSLHLHKASGDIVLVKVDDASLRKVGRWPWPRRYHAQLADELTKAGAKRVFFDVAFYGPSDPVDDQLLSKVIQRSGRVVLPMRSVESPNAALALEAPPPMFAEHAQLGTIQFDYNYQNAVWQLPYARTSDGNLVPSFAAMLANKRALPSTFLIDYSIDPRSVPTISAGEILGSRFDPNEVRGKDVVVGGTADIIGDSYFIPGTGTMGGAYVHIIGAETLKAGTPIHLGWIPLLLLAIGAAATAVVRKKEEHQALLLTGSFLALLLGPAALEAHLIYLDVVPGILAILIISAIIIRSRFRKRGLVDPISGLPNLNALRLNKQGRAKALIAARILNYSEIVSALPSDKERQLVEQIVGRLSVGAPDRIFYEGDGGIFAWFDDPLTPFGHHLEALYALFRNPVRVGGMSIDLSVSFGVEIGSSRSLANRLGSALVAAEEAAQDGLKWKYYDPEALQDASWRLSMLSQLDDAIDHGQVWVAFQPKLDLNTRQIIGAEALARWTHPEKGPIAASEFVAAAEQHDRIGKLTMFVLDQAIAAGAALNKGGREFEIAVNLSGRLLGERALVGRIAILLERHGLAARHLTLELTETAAIAGSGDALDMLSALRELGANISIDDYGTGLSTLDYLKKIPAGEIKIDQSFIKGMVDNRSERLMVQSTVALAHSLGRRIVAEGVEDRETLELLAEMECDIAQGFIVGRPMSLESLRRRISSDRSRSAA
jgi:EAL domain-containing protein (putative c-di-GMP-specific phosphodiesterase class I)/CHASE2 domain-containing sensor protein